MSGGEPAPDETGRSVSPDESLDLAERTELATDRAPGPASEVRRPGLPREVWVLVAGGFVIAVGYGLATPILPSYAAGFGVGATGVGLIVSSYALSRLLFSPVAGSLLQRWNERPVYLIGTTIVASASVAMAFAPSYGWLIAGRLFGGIGSSMYTISCFALIVRVTPPPLRGRASAVFATGFLLGNISGPLFGGVLGEISIRLPFLVHAAVLLLAVAVVGALMPAVRSREKKWAGPSCATTTFATALRHPTYRASLVSNFSMGWAVLGVRIAILPLFAIEVLDAGPALAGYALTAFALGNAAVLPLTGRWADAAGRRVPVILGLLLCGTSTATVGFAPSEWSLLALCISGGAGVGLATPGQQATVADVVGGRRGGNVMAAFQMSADLGTVLGPVAAGLIVDHAGYEPAFLASGIGMILASILWMAAPETLPSRHEARPSTRPPKEAIS